MVPERFQLWRSKITNSDQYKPEPDLTANSRICSKHFVKQDYLDNCSNKPVTGNHILSKDAVPSRFRWSTENCDVSAAVPFVRRIKPTQQQQLHSNGRAQHHFQQHQHNFQQHNAFSRPCNKDNTCIEHSAVEKQTQCSFEDERLKNEISRKNSIIQQLLERISQLEAEHKATTQILLKETISVGTPTSVIKSTSQNVTKDSTVIKEYPKLHQNDSIAYSVPNTNTGTVVNSKKRKFPEDDEDENIHYVLLSLSEKVVRHDNNNAATDQIIHN